MFSLDNNKSMKLEIIEEQPLSLSRPHSLLFLSGLGQTAWLWQETFMPFFAKHGYACYAMNLRGHGKSEGKERIKQSSGHRRGCSYHAR